MAVQFVNQQYLRKEQQLRFFDIAPENGQGLKPEQPSLVRSQNGESAPQETTETLSSEGNQIRLPGKSPTPALLWETPPGFGWRSQQCSSNNSP